MFFLFHVLCLGGNSAFTMRHVFQMLIFDVAREFVLFPHCSAMESNVALASIWLVSLVFSVITRAGFGSLAEKVSLFAINWHCHI